MIDGVIVVLVVTLFSSNNNPKHAMFDVRKVKHIMKKSIIFNCNYSVTL